MLYVKQPHVAREPRFGHPWSTHPSPCQCPYPPHIHKTTPINEGYEVRNTVQSRCSGVLPFVTGPDKSARDHVAGYWTPPSQVPATAQITLSSVNLRLTSSQVYLLYGTKLPFSHLLHLSIQKQFTRYQITPKAFHAF